MTDLLEKDKTYKSEPGDDDRLSHYVSKREWDQGYLEGKEVTALCGHKFIPTKDPERFPVCPKCKEIWETKE